MRTFATYAALVLIAGALHLAWEYLHLPLYAGYEALGTGLGLVLWATMGDIFYTLLIAFGYAAQRGHLTAFTDLHARNYVAVALWGCIIALFVEYKAWYLHRWTYAAAMPIIPLLQVGLSPIMQMVILTPVAFAATRVVISALGRPPEYPGVQ